MKKYSKIDIHCFRLVSRNGFISESFYDLIQVGFISESFCDLIQVPILELSHVKMRCRIPSPHVI